MNIIDNSSERTVEVFFYGLYMDNQVLEQKGVTPRNPRAAYVENFEVKIGKRVTLLRAPQKKAFGVVYSLTHNEIHSLYWGAGIEDYKAEALLVHFLTGGTLPALCCIMLHPPHSDEQNPEYKQKLNTLLAKLQLPTL